MKSHREYLGDSVYADFNERGHLIVLTTENGLGPSNTIYLEPAVMEALKLYESNLIAYFQEQREQNEKNNSESSDGE